MSCSATGPSAGPGSPWAPRTLTHRGRGTTMSLTQIGHMSHGLCLLPTARPFLCNLSNLSPSSSPARQPPSKWHSLSPWETPSQHKGSPPGVRCVLPAPPSPFSSASLPTGWMQL